MRLHRCVLLLAVALATMASLPRARSQDPAAVPPAAEQRNGSVATETVSPESADSSLLLRTEDGKLVPLSDLLDPDLLAELISRARQQTEIPLYDISRLDVTGIVQGNTVTLKADITVTVRPGSEWVAVPLSLPEVHVTGMTYQSDASDGQSVPQLADPTQRRWYLYGQGVHRLHLDLITRTRPTSTGGHQLSLSLPPATQSRLDLQFRDPVELQGPPADTALHVRSGAGGVTGVEVWGAGRECTIAWSDIVQRVEAVPLLRVQNRMLLDLTTVPILLSGTSAVQISSAPVDELRIQFPPGYQLLELDARGQSDTSILSSTSTEDTVAGQVAVIGLASATEGQITLIWDLELVSAPFPRDVVVKLPTIDGASLQNGDLDILIPPGLLVQQRSIIGAQRRRVGTEASAGVSATAFRLRSAESQIDLQVDEIEALFTVSPELVVEPDQQNAVVTVRFPVNVLRGSLLDIDFHWPGFETGVWQLLPRSARLASGSTRSPISLEQSAAEEDAFSLRFPERQSGQFTVELQAFAPLDGLAADEAILTCPEIRSESVQPVVITTVDSDAFTLLPLDAETGNLLRKLPGRAPADSSQPGQSATSWIVERARDRIRFHVNSQAPSVTASIQVALMPAEFGIEVRELISYEIEHRDLTGVSLEVPDGIQPIVRRVGDAEPLRGTVDDSETRTFRLTAPQRGTLSLEVTYLVPSEETGPGTGRSGVTLPLILPRQADIEQIEVGSVTMPAFRVTDAVNWRPVFSEQFGTAWASKNGVSEIPLRWDTGVTLHPGDTPAVLLVRTTVVENSLLTSTTALFERRPEIIRVVVPGSLMLQDVAIAGTSVRDGLQAQRLDSSTDVLWTIHPDPPASSAGQVADTAFAVELRTRQQISSGATWVSPLNIDHPRFPSDNSGLTLLQWVESPDSYQFAPDGSSMMRLSDPSSVPAVQPSAMTAIPQIEAIASAHQPGIQDAIRDYSEIASPRAAAVYYVAGADRSLQLYMIPSVPLLLISASVCLLCFLLLIQFPRLSMVNFVVLAGLVGIVCIVFTPTWSTILAPYIVVGILFALVAVAFQRMTGDRPARVLRSPHPLDLPSVFGFSELLPTASGHYPPASADLPGPRKDLPVSAT